MSVKLPSPLNIKRLYFNASNKLNVDRAVINGYFTEDGVEYVITSTDWVLAKSYTFTVGSNANAVRVVVIGGGAYFVTTYVRLVIDGVIRHETSRTGSDTLMDYVGSLTPGSHTVEIWAMTDRPDSPPRIRVVRITAGFIVNQTTPVTILSLSGLDAEYELGADGNFEYRLGVRYWIVGIAKLTVDANVTSNLANTIRAKDELALAPIDTGHGILVYETGDFRPDLTLTANVGASGDYIIVTGIFTQVTFRGVSNISPSIIVRERGLIAVDARVASIKGYNIAPCVLTKKDDTWDTVWTGTPGLDVEGSTLLVSITRLREVGIDIVRNGYVPANWDETAHGAFLSLAVMVIQS